MVTLIQEKNPGIWLASFCRLLPIRSIKFRIANLSTPVSRHADEYTSGKYTNSSSVYCEESIYGHA